MAYKYERSIKNLMINANGVSWTNIKTHKNAYDELLEVYCKAKCFDQVLKIDNQATDEDRITGQYESDIETVLSEYKEANDETQY